MATQKKKKFQFSGHETFTFRQNWPFKIVDFCNSAISRGEAPDFNDPDAVVTLGVGKNMVSSMKWWGMQCGFLDNTEKSIAPSSLSQLIFGGNDVNIPEPLDPYGESKAVAWIAHWNLLKEPNRFTAAWFLFNVYNDQLVTRDKLQKKISEFAKTNGVKISENTIKRDIEIVFRSYCPTGTNKKELSEDTADCLFSDLNLITTMEDPIFEISRSVRTTLPTSLFAWAVLDHWEMLNQISDSNTLDWFDIAFAANSPGRVFKLNESDLNERLEDFETLTDGKIAWADQLGIKNLVRRTKDKKELMKLKEKMLIKAFRE